MDLVKPYSIRHIAEVLKAEVDWKRSDASIAYLVTDSRSVIQPSESLFFALSGQRDGHEFMGHAYAQGIRNFVCTGKGDYPLWLDANLLIVADVQAALQALAIHHRSRFATRVLGITGSNGKTIVKEWLYQLLSPDHQVMKSPKSYNSQIGVPLSVWQMESNQDIAILEAGISTVGEMCALEAMIHPHLGILTTIGEAHAEGFESPTQKTLEKLRLFERAALLICHLDSFRYLDSIPEWLPPLFTWSKTGPADLQLKEVERLNQASRLTFRFRDQEASCEVGFTDQASMENIALCVCTLLVLNYPLKVILTRIEKLTAIEMRLGLIAGIHHCSIIDDSYIADLSSLGIALDFLQLQNQHAERSVLLSDILQSGKDEESLYVEIAALLKQKQVAHLVGIGPAMVRYQHLFPMGRAFFTTTEDFLNEGGIHLFHKETVLVKGARRFGFERIIQAMAQKIHETVLEINLNALQANLQFYRHQLSPGVRTMAMVKAFSYGSGSFEIANLLQYQKVDYLTVAYADEGVALREAGITLPIMVMSPTPAVFESMIRAGLEPEIYELDMLKTFMDQLGTLHAAYPVHLKLDTGMHRLGFMEEELPALKELLQQRPSVRVKSVFTHLVASGDSNHDPFTREQFSRYHRMYETIVEVLSYRPWQHVLNTSGISRWREAQLDMVRLGIGMYGYDEALVSAKVLQPVAVLKTTVTQVKKLTKGESVGYGRKGIMPRDGQIATVKIGYADGYNRRFGNGVGKMLIGGKLVPTIGTICMDMTMLDVTGIQVEPGDEVVVFNEVLRIETLADQIETIPYELLTGISQRVKRVYFYE